MASKEGNKRLQVGPWGDHATQPEREPLEFLVDTENLSPDKAKVVGSIKQLAESMLFHWKFFPIVLPESITEKRAARTSSHDTDYHGAVQFKDLFVAPTFDELEAVATGDDGQLKKLNKEQLNMVQKKGEFDVQSLNFPGQIHRWRLSMFLQKGSDRTNAAFHGDLSKALYLLIITARKRLCSNFFSVTEAFRGWTNGLWNLLDIVIGMPSTTPGDLCQKLEEERMRYLVAELDIKANLTPELNTYCEYIMDQCQMLGTKKHMTTELRPPPIPYRYQTPKGQDIDLRLFNKDLMNNCMGILSNILDRQAKGWHVSMRAKLIRHFQGQGLSNKEISKAVSDEIMSHYLDKVFTAIASNAELEGLQPGLGQLLVDQAKSVMVMIEAHTSVQNKMEEHKQKLVEHLRKTHPIKSRIQAWMDEQLWIFENDFANQHLYTAHEAAISMCDKQELHQTVYFLRRDVNFIKERESVLRKELSRVKIPTREFNFSTRIWLPQNWVVYRGNPYSMDIIPTVIKWEEPSKQKNENIHYIVLKTVERKTTTRYPFWRWWNFLHRVWSWTWNAMFIFGIVIPWASNVSLRALVWPSAFVPDKQQSQADGSLYPRESSRIHTLMSRLRALWANVHLSRTKFEATPDRGFLGKSMTRHFNRVWNYVFKGAVGSALIVVVFPPLCLVLSSLSVVAAVLTPVWVPVATLIAQIFGFLIFDFDNPYQEKNRLFILFEAIIWNLLLQGCLQPLAAVCVGVVVCPLASLIMCLFGVARSGMRIVWDTLMFHIIIKSRGRIPASNSFVARRTAGPGLASNYFYQIRPEQALAAVEARIEHDELEAWKSQMMTVVEEPRDVYRKFVTDCFEPFSASLIEQGAYARLSRETFNYTKDLQYQTNEREKLLFTGLTNDLQRRIKLVEKDLKVTVMYTSRLLEEFYPDHVIPRLTQTEEEFWEQQELEYRDWRGFAAKKLKEIFSPTFLVPLEETDNCFQLKVNHMNVERYADMLATTDFHDDLDIVVELHTPEGDINVSAPYLDVGYFDPNRKQIKGREQPLNSRNRRCIRSDHSPIEFDKLEVPLPVSHPASIAISIYNRENDQDQIDLNDVHCQRVVRATKEQHRKLSAPVNQSRVGQTRVLNKNK